MDKNDRSGGLKPPRSIVQISGLICAIIFFIYVLIFSPGQPSGFITSGIVLSVFIGGLSGVCIGYHYRLYLLQKISKKMKREFWAFNVVQAIFLLSTLVISIIVQRGLNLPLLLIVYIVVSFTMMTFTSRGKK